MFSAKDASVAPVRIWRRLTFSDCGDLVFSVSSCFSDQSEPSASSAAKISSTVSKANSRSMASRWASSGAGPASPATRSATALGSDGLARSSSFKAAVAPLSTKWVWMPRATVSAAFSLAPVSASQTPVCPGRRGRNQPPPTSGNRPMPVSGMA
ncbi:hypothetical protein D3C72_1889640 [compost metagenome]